MRRNDLSFRGCLGPLLHHALVVALWGSPVCHARAAPGRPPQPLPSAVPLHFSPAVAPQQRFFVQLAATPAQHARGLMHTTQLAPAGGMLFVFDSAETRSFWMKNTYVPLDLIFLDAKCRVVGLRPNAVPHDETELTVATPAQYVVELHAGRIAAMQLKLAALAHFDVPGHRCPRVAAP